MRLKKLSSRFANTSAGMRIDRAIDGLGQLAAHEAQSLDRHALALRERLSVARKARGVGELLRDQLDLIPATTMRFAHDHRVRRKLWSDLGKAVSGRNPSDAS